MSSELRIALPLVLLGTLGGIAGCGHKAPPYPPPAKNPARTADLQIQQRGQMAILSFTYPQTTVSGELLETLETIEIWRATKPVSPPTESEEEALPEEDTSETGDAPGEESVVPADPEDGEETADEISAYEESSEEDAEEADEGEDDLPEIPLEELTAADALEFNAIAALVETLNAEAIEQSVDGDKLVLSVDLEEASHEMWSHTFAIKSFASEKLVSAYSNLVTLVQRQPPPEPIEFQAEAEADGVRLSWSLAESAEELTEAVKIYRRSSDSRLYGGALIRLGSETVEYLDRSADFGERYIYAVTAVGHENPLVESFFGGEREIDYADRFAPDPPTNLIVLAEAGRVRILWDASGDDDVVGYIVFRRQAGGEFLRLTEEPVVGVEYNDRTVTAGTTYDYRVSAIDGVGNQGDQSSSVIARVP